MSRLNDLLRKLDDKDPALAADLKREVDALADRRAFGLNFERHVPEAVELPGRKVRKGDKVRILPPRGTTTAGDQRLWRVTAVDRTTEVSTASLTLLEGSEETTSAVSDLVVVAEFRDPIYPGLVSTGKVERGGDKPYHAVINAENFHALQTLLFTHRGKVDCIYIDPPYNTGAKDWKYNNDYVEGDDIYRHSKWLAFIERRLMLARELLNPANSVLIVTIDEREYLRLGLLLEQIFPDATIQMVSSIINPKGVSKGAGFRRADEYIFFVMLGASTPMRLPLGPEWSASANSRVDSTGESDETATIEPGWTSMMRRGSNSARADRPQMFYPIYADASDPANPKIASIGDPLPLDIHEPPRRGDLIPILPLRRNGSEGRWQVGHAELASRIKQGRVRLGRQTAYGFVVNYLPDGAYSEVMSDRFIVEGYANDGSIIARGSSGDNSRVAPTQWKIASHNASEYGSTLLDNFVPGRKFPFPKSLYAVEDTLRFFLGGNPNAIVVDFFAGSGTTCHALMRLNHQDNGNRKSICITNNEVSVEEQISLRSRSLRPGDADWEARGICDYITVPRLRAAAEGRTPNNEPIKGSYKFVNEAPMSDGFDENIEFFRLTYETPMRVSSNREFTKIAPLLWIRAGSRGRRIIDLSTGWGISDVYGVLADLNQAEAFLKEVRANGSVAVVFIVTDENRVFEAIAHELPEHVEPVRLYEAYLRNFEIESGRSSL